MNTASHRTSARDERGQAIIFTGFALVALFALTAFGLDVSLAMYSRREIQASSDAAVLAGALDLPNSSQAISRANTYSGIATAKNTRSNHPVVTMASGYPRTKCVTSVPIACSPVNAIVVKQQMTVPTFFARVIGINALHVSATSTASMKGGVPKPLDVMVVLDTTASMNSSCSASVPGVSSPSKLECALAGARALLSGMWPCAPSLPNCGAASGGNVAQPLDKVGLMVFPGLKVAGTISREFDCSNNITGSDVQAYASSPIYTIVGLSSDYRVSSTSGLNGAVSNLVKAVDWTDGNGCGSGAYGLESPGGVGTYFADALSQAQASLTANGRSDAQDVIILLSDGDSSYTGVSNPCHRAITAAGSSTAAGTWVYSIAYGASSSGGCSNDSPAISPLATMQQIASDSSKFFNQPTFGDLTAIFQRIVVDLTTTRLISDDAP